MCNCRTQHVYTFYPFFSLSSHCVALMRETKPTLLAPTHHRRTSLFQRYKPAEAQHHLWSQVSTLLVRVWTGQYMKSADGWPGHLAQLSVCQRVAVFLQQVPQQLQASLKTEAAAPVWHQSNQRDIYVSDMRVELTSSPGRATYTRLAKRLQINNKWHKVQCAGGCCVLLPPTGRETKLQEVLINSY